MLDIFKTETEEEGFWHTGFGHILGHLLAALIITFLAAVLVALASQENQIKFMFYIMYYLGTAGVLFLGSKLTETTKRIDKVKTRILEQNQITHGEILEQNEKTNKELIRIATKDIEEKVYRKLVRANAVIPERNYKVAITARILDDFHNKDVYKLDGSHKKTTESIDFVRELSYQNLLLTPKYLEYFFYRKDHVRKATRIIVLDREHVKEQICQAALTYIFISARYGYETYILPDEHFRKIIRANSYSEENLKMIKGNPFMLKITKDSGVEYSGEYTNYQANFENNGEVVIINSGEEAWKVLENIKINSLRIQPEDAQAAGHIKAAISRVISNPITTNSLD
jgi:hypothetical protein